MQICRDIASIRLLRLKLEGRVALVPTMGALHEGHLELMRVASEYADHVIASIFVNPTQFGPGEDLEAYPRQLEEDAALCASVGCAAVFAPSVEEIYPEGHLTSVSVAKMTEVLCGASREGHFDGVTTIVSKFFNIIAPTHALFGQKDYQQLAVIHRMVQDMNFPIVVVGVPTVREEDGLAMSSRNRYLDEEQRVAARALSRGLTRAWSAWWDGERDTDALVYMVSKEISGQPDLAIDYVKAVDPETLAPLSGRVKGGCLLALAVYAGEARLIDNLSLDESLPPALRRAYPKL